MRIIRLVGMLAALLFAAETAMAATYCVRSGATGANNGSDWANAYTALPSTLARGDTYYVAGGSYASRTLNTPVSGTSVIAIKGATNADHGIGTGWSSAYSVSSADGGSQAVWTGTWQISTGYWVVDGSAGPMWSRTPAEYGFAFKYSGSPSQLHLVTLSGTGTTAIQISHVAAVAPTTDIEKHFVRVNTGSSVYNVTVANNYGRYWSNFVYGMGAKTGWIIERNIILEGFSSAANHGEDINNDAGNPSYTIRYNWFEGRAGGTACIVALNASAGPYYIYGNVFKNMGFGDGCITGITNGYGTQNMTGVVYNNTFINVEYNPYNYSRWIGYNMSAVIVRNNMVYNQTYADLGAGSHNIDYDAYVNITNATPSEANKTVSTGSPFVNEANNDVHLVAPTAAGATLANDAGQTYNVDAYGNIRGADGVWDRGAVEYVSGSKAVTHTVTPSAGTNGTISPKTAQTVADGASLQFTVTPNAGYAAAVGGTCGGSLAGTVYTTKAVAADCTVVATFTATGSVTLPVPPPGVWVE